MGYWSARHGSKKEWRERYIRGRVGCVSEGGGEDRKLILPGMSAKVEEKPDKAEKEEEEERCV